MRKCKECAFFTYRCTRADASKAFGSNKWYLEQPFLVIPIPSAPGKVDASLTVFKCHRLLAGSEI